MVDYGDSHVPEYSCEFPSLTTFEGDNVAGGQKFVKNVAECGVATQQLADLVEKAARDDKVCLTIGGWQLSGPILLKISK